MESRKSFRLNIAVFIGVIIVLVGGLVKNFPDFPIEFWSLVWSGGRLVLLIAAAVLLRTEISNYRKWKREEKSIENLMGVEEEIKANKPGYPPPGNGVLDEESYREVQKR